jgi:hypothetical protein
MGGRRTNHWKRCRVANDGGGKNINEAKGEVDGKPWHREEEGKSSQEVSIIGNKIFQLPKDIDK